MGSCPLSPLGRYFFLPAWRVLTPLLKAILRLEVIGRENIPTGPCIVASNHRSHLDPPVLNLVFSDPLVFLAKEELFKPPLGYLLKHMRAIPVRRSAEDLSVLEKSVELLRSGCKVCIFPEGTRANPGEFRRPKPGVGYMAVKSGFPVLPVYIEGTDRILPRGAKLPKPGKVKVVIGKPVSYGGLEPSVKNFKKVSLDIMERIKELSYSFARK
ncbi:lysophospholipid acyltransferase family protein [Aquifex pyrophilus]